MLPEITYKATPNYFHHIITTILLIIAIGGYFIGLNEFVLIAAGFFAVVRMFDEDVSILICKDSFTIRYANYFGKLMSRKYSYSFQDVEKFDVEIDKLKTSEKTLITIANIFLPGRQRSPFFDPPKANVFIEYLNEFKDPYEIELSFYYRGENYELAFERIKKKLAIKKADQNKF